MGLVDRLPSAVAAALEAADIPSARLGPTRSARLTAGERELYFWILRRFASEGRPSAEETRAAAERLELDFERAAAKLAREDLLHLDPDGEIAVAYPFSGRPSAHRVRFPDGHEVDAMCAIDALGVAPMFGREIEIFSRDPVSGEEITVRFGPDGRSEWEPREAVVVAGSASSGAAFRSCCSVLNFFASSATADRWLAGHADVRGLPISIVEAIETGRLVFGDVFEAG